MGWMNFQGIEMIFIKIVIMAIVSFNSFSFEVGDCIKIKRKNKDAGVVFYVHEKKEDSLGVSSRAIVLDHSFLGLRNIKLSQEKYFEKAECDALLQ